VIVQPSQARELSGVRDDSYDGRLTTNSMAGW
jgi:hypothetical protein